MPTRDEFKYHVFVSYSHSDGRGVARWLQRKIASYRLPASTLRQKARDYERQFDRPGELRDHIEDLKRRRRVVRDETDLTANPNLWDAIREKLLASRFLLLVATPGSAASRWISKEVEEFRRVRGRNILTVLAAGTPEMSLPQPLKEDLLKGREPLYADFRRSSAWWAFWKWPEHAAQRRDSFLKVLAPIWGVELADLRRDDAILQSARFRRWITGLCLALGISLLFFPPIQHFIEGAVARWLNRHVSISRADGPPAVAVINGQPLKGIPAYLFQYHDWSRPFLKRLVVPELVVLPPGTFRMGGRALASTEGPVVINVERFAIGRFEVTNAQYRSFCSEPGRTCPSEPAPGYGGIADAPVVFVAWDEAQTYLRWLAALTAIRYRLPTEAEWEYAARAGSDRKYGFDDSPDRLRRYAWYGKRSEGKPIDENHGEPVGLLKSNAWWLYDMQGNAWEMTNTMCVETRPGQCKYPYRPTPDLEQPGLNYRVMRGGSWYADATDASLISRFRWHPGKRDGTVSFRAAADLAR